MAYHALIPAGGSGTRFGGALPKQYGLAAGRPLLAHVIDAFSRCPRIAATHVVVAPGDDHVGRFLPDLPAEVRLLRVGGESRQESVLNGLDALATTVAEDDWILVHDAARPNLTQELIDRLIIAVGDDAVGGLLALPVVDTLKREDGGRVAVTVARAGLWQAQTPQMFRYGLLRKALRAAGAGVTDEASAIEALGWSPLLVAGSARNFKVTWRDDLVLADALLRKA